jgi:chaperonin GroES
VSVCHILTLFLKKCHVSLFGINYAQSGVSKQILTLKLDKMAQLKGKILAGKVLVKPNEAEAKTASGIIIPDSAKEKPRQGKVMLVGAAKKDEEMEVKKGDEVLYGKYSGQELTINGEDYLLVSQSDILFIL